MQENADKELEKALADAAKEAAMTPEEARTALTVGVWAAVTATTGSVAQSPGPLLFSWAQRQGP